MWPAVWALSALIQTPLLKCKASIFSDPCIEYTELPAHGMGGMPTVQGPSVADLCIVNRIVKGEKAELMCV